MIFVGRTVKAMRPCATAVTINVAHAKRVLPSILGIVWFVARDLDVLEY